MTETKSTTPDTTLLSGRLFPSISLVLVGGGFLLLVWSAWSVFTTDNSEGPLYKYDLVAEGGIDQFEKLGLTEGDVDDLMIHKYEVRVDGIDKPLADFHVGFDSREIPVLLNWNNHLAEPVLTMHRSSLELNLLVKAVTEHLPEKSTVLTWWDTARGLELLADVNSPFNENLAQPVIIPDLWNTREGEIAAIEHSFWKVPEEVESRDQFDSFVDALLADENTGIAKLKALSSEQETYIIVHMTDAYRLGVMRPDSFGIGYKDFPKGGQLHGLIEHVKDWLKEQGHDSYLITPMSDTFIRVFFLTDETSTQSLMAKLLPFNTSNPLLLETIQLVGQYKGYWVYKLPASEKENI